MLPLTTADLLTHAIVGSVLENLDMERLVREVGHAVAQRILGNNESVDDVARELHEKLLLRNESTKKVVIESIYKESEEAKHNVAVFSQAPSLAEARPLLKRVRVPFLQVVLKDDPDFGFFRCMERASLTSTSKPGTRSRDMARATAATAPFHLALHPSPKSPPRPLLHLRPVRLSAISRPLVLRKLLASLALLSLPRHSLWLEGRLHLAA